MNKKNALILVSLVYVLAAIVAYYFVQASPENNILIKAAAADVIATMVVFIASVLLSNSSVYDPYWSVAPLPIAIYWLISGGAPDLTVKKALVLLLILWWGGRLTWNWARSWPGLHHEDWRYKMLAEKTGDAYWAVSLLGIHLFPTVVVFLGMLPVLVVMQASDSVGILDILALAVGVAAILIETVADNQLRRFVQRKEKDRGEVLQSGLWSYSRHPNYLGEIMFWLSLYLFALGCGREHWWTGVGFLAMVLLFVFISVPMMEKRQIANKPAYAEYKRRVSAILPIRRGSSR